jgi:predicted DsbA family dithiol-disulfide isomerase
MSEALAIDVFVDVVCPWCLLGHARLERVLATLDRPAAVHYRPFLLDPDTPPEGTDIPAMLARKYGPDFRRIWTRLEGEARKVGIDLDLSRQRWSFPTERAHVLIRHAAGKGTQPALVRALFRANFLDARNVSDPAVLADVAGPHGFAGGEVERLVNDSDELARTRAEAEQAIAMGVHGVPLFVFGGRVAVSGAQPEDVLRAAIDRAGRE